MVEISQRAATLLAMAAICGLFWGLIVTPLAGVVAGVLAVPTFALVCAPPRT